ncbi:hypothetical protein GQ457_15G016270 [Hibiscus cannabinus]
MSQHAEPIRQPWDVSFQVSLWKGLSFSHGARHRAYWAIKKLNLDAQLAGERRMIELNELEEFRTQAYENAYLYKEKMKRWHDNHILPQHFREGQRFSSTILDSNFFRAS